MNNYEELVMERQALVNTFEKNRTLAKTAAEAVKTSARAVRTFDAKHGTLRK